MVIYVMFHLQINPSLIEVVKGYGVKCTQRQLNNEEANSVDLPQKSSGYSWILSSQKKN